MSNPHTLQEFNTRITNAINKVEIVGTAKMGDQEHRETC